MQKQVQQHEANGSNQIILNEWIRLTRQFLISLEEKVVQTRAKELERIVNGETKHINEQLFQRNEHVNEAAFQYKVEQHKMTRFIRFIYEWNGLSSTAKIPSTYKQYETKSRNWLNGRRNKQYGDSLFEDMLTAAFNHAESVSSQRFNASGHEKLRSLYFYTLVYALLVQICTKRVRINGTAKKLYLITEHAMKTKCSTKSLLQKYVKQHKYSRQFPSHRHEAIDYYQQQYEATLNSLKSELNDCNLLKVRNAPLSALQQQAAANDIDDASDFDIETSSNTHVVDGEHMIAHLLKTGDILPVRAKDAEKTVIITLATFHKIGDVVQSMQNQHMMAQQKICELKRKIEALECDKKTLQQSSTQQTMDQMQTVPVSKHAARWDQASFNQSEHISDPWFVSRADASSVIHGTVGIDDRHVLQSPIGFLNEDENLFCVDSAF